MQGACVSMLNALPHTVADADAEQGSEEEVLQRMQQPWVGALDYTSGSESDADSVEEDPDDPRVSHGSIHITADYCRQSTERPMRCHTTEMALV